MPRIAIACYRPKNGQEDILLDIVRRHVPTLRQEGLVTERPALVMKAEDGTLVEVFEWASQDAKNQAHEDDRQDVAHPRHPSQKSYAACKARGSGPTVVLQFFTSEEFRHGPSPWRRPTASRRIT